MPYDLFVSYARRNNERGQVLALVEQIRAKFRAFAGRELEVFFDQDEIRGMEDWRRKIQESLRNAQLFLAVLSPEYLASSYCRWEWEDYVRYEAMRQCLGDGIAPVYFVTLPDARTLNNETLANWIAQIRRRQAFKLQAWHDTGEQALEQAHVRETLAELAEEVRQRLDRAGRARRSPTNVMRHNPRFVGRVAELAALREGLAKNQLGIISSSAGPRVATVQGVGGMGKTELALAYAHAFAWDYPGGRWQLRCEHLGDLRVALLQLEGPFGLELSVAEKRNLPLVFDRLLRELGRRERSLLLLDNVTEPQLFEPEHLERLPRDGHVDLIVTTRLAPREIPGAGPDQGFIAIDAQYVAKRLDGEKGQICYYHEKAAKAHQRRSQLSALFIGCSVAALILAVIYLGLHTFGGQSHGSRVSPMLGFVLVMLPMVAAGATSLISLYDLDRQVERFGGMAAFLRRERSHILHAPSEGILRRAVYRTEHGILQEVVEWHAKHTHLKGH
jgi:hypothetical protein